MKKFWLLLLTLIPISASAESYYTEYQEYLVNQTNRIETNDLIKEEEIKYYQYLNQRINEGYYLKEKNPLDAPYYDENDKIIASKKESNKLHTKATRGLLLSLSNDYPVSFIEIIAHTYLPSFTLYDLNYQKVINNFENNKIILKEPILISQLLIVIDYEEDTGLDLLINGVDYFNINLNNSIIKQYELNFIHQDLFNNRLAKIGIYTGAKYQSYLYYINYTYLYKYYNLNANPEIKTIAEEGYDLIEIKYNYFKRDLITFKDYLILNKDNQNLFDYVAYSSNSDELTISGDIDYQKNGVYQINYLFEELTIPKNVVVINEQKEPIKETIVEEKIIVQEKIIKNDCPNIIEEKTIEKECPKQVVEKLITKECPKPKTQIIYKPKIVEKIKYSPCPIKNNKKIAKDFSFAYIIPGIPLIILFLVLNKRRYKINKAKLKQ